MKIHNELKTSSGHLDDIVIKELGIRIRAKRFSSVRHASHQQLRDLIERSLCSQVY
jgi:hypothetical protein